MYRKFIFNHIDNITYFDINKLLLQGKIMPRKEEIMLTDKTKNKL